MSARKKWIRPNGVVKVHMAHPFQHVERGVLALCGSVWYGDTYADDADQVTCAGCLAKMARIVSVLLNETGREIGE